MMFIEMLCGALMTLCILYVVVAYQIWNLSENDSEIGNMTVKEFARKLYCTHWSVRLFETNTEEKEA